MSQPTTLVVCETCGQLITASAYVVRAICCDECSSTREALVVLERDGVRSTHLLRKGSPRRLELQCEGEPPGEVLEACRGADGYYPAALCTCGHLEFQHEPIDPDGTLDPYGREILEQCTGGTPEQPCECWCFDEWNGTKCACGARAAVRLGDQCDRCWRKPMGLLTSAEREGT